VASQSVYRFPVIPFWQNLSQIELQTGSATQTKNDIAAPVTTALKVFGKSNCTINY